MSAEVSSWSCSDGTAIIAVPVLADQTNERAVFLIAHSIVGSKRTSNVCAYMCGITF